MKITSHIIAPIAFKNFMELKLFELLFKLYNKMCVSVFSRLRDLLCFPFHPSNLQRTFPYHNYAYFRCRNIQNHNEN